MDNDLLLDAISDLCYRVSEIEDDMRRINCKLDFIIHTLEDAGIITESAIKDLDGCDTDDFDIGCGDI